MTYFIKRRLRTVSDRIKRVKDELNVLDEQLLQLQEEADDAHVRSLVSEAPADSVAYDDARRQHEIIAKERDRQRNELQKLSRERDELLDRLAARAAKSSARE